MWRASRMRPSRPDCPAKRRKALQRSEFSFSQQQCSPRQAVRPSLTATAAITNATTGSAHDQPNSRFSSNPTSSTPERYVHSSVWWESATALAEPSSRPARRCAYDSSGMTTSDTAAKTIPAVEDPAVSPPSRDRTDSTVT
jgi:hypothetical protein